MAKKKAAEGFNMAEEIRTLLTGDPKLTGKEVMEALKAKFPNAKINGPSAGVAYSNARKKLGIVKGTTNRPKASKSGSVRKRLPSGVTSSRRAPVDIATLQAAAKFVSQIGGADLAIEAVRQVVALQITK